MRIARAPVAIIDAVTVYDADGTATVLGSADYQIDTTSRPARLVIDAGAPTPGVSVNGIEIDFTAGYGTVTDVPAPLTLAIRRLVAQWYETHEGPEGGDVPGSVAALIAPYRLIGLGAWT
ncbi:hypothetical protein [Breoghania sp.]|uniref:head-tail connector protein n=1 Tax=Breoghania sp. TaxID=2065378 RepID=UPI002608CAC6|nr:hypothetical protein [Breoghania sp.]MDJ0931826.1 hypothetical protein [Breoghania sp.]